MEPLNIWGLTLLANSSGQPDLQGLKVASGGSSLLAVVSHGRERSPRTPVSSPLLETGFWVSHRPCWTRSLGWGVFWASSPAAGAASAPLPLQACLPLTLKAATSFLWVGCLSCREAPSAERGWMAP